MDKDDYDEVTSYEELRLKNLEDNKLMLKKLMLDSAHLQPFKPVAPPKKRKPQRKILAEDSFLRRNPSRNARAAPARFDLPYTRSRSGSVSSTMSSTSSSSTSTPMSTPEKLVVRFGFFKSFSDRSSTVSSNDLENLNEDEEGFQLPVQRRKPRAYHEVLSTEDITQAHLDMVAVVVSDKKYDSFQGTTCHQCRQKTDDMKTICRSSNCLGVKGQFCGPCLRNRYGEDAKVALKDPDWICPPCRGICNCSFCRKKKGRTCTGILIHVARERGFSDVSSYLASIGSKTTQDWS
ncbi:pyridoxine-5'-phosphate oxidase-like [Plakobranchus ocellatus]|uniref:Pyridoxine-5'-phosphate oxidase-like n=1 Tax=Plakobranchus ocellatus TaxID=259542 RepID=A0AAV3YJ96_9GAST|nr:pyridoxine-5'-phosphate oxidase-like [Plakobranchus ocellatus]